LTTEQKIAREMSAAQLGITAQQTQRAMPGAPPSVLGSEVPLPTFQPLPGGRVPGPSSSLPSSEIGGGELPLKLDELNKLFKTMSEGIEGMVKTARKTNDQLKNSRT